MPEPGAGAGARAVEKKPGAGQKRTGFATLYKVYMDQEPTFCYDWSDTVLCMRKTLNNILLKNGNYRKPNKHTF